MTPKNLPTAENNYKSDWWILEKISQKALLRKLKNNRFLNPSDSDKWWNFGLATKVIIVFACLGLIFAYQNSATISTVFPTTIATIQKANIAPEFFAKIGFDIKSRYNLSSLFIPIKKERGEETSIITSDALIEEPIKILISKIAVNAAVINPTTSDLETLNDALKLGAVRYPESGLLGEDKNIFIFGHSTSLETERAYYKTFNNLDKLSRGDEIILQSINNEYIYKVISVFLTNTEATIEFDDSEKKIILSTCNTLGQKEERYVVEADFVKNLSLLKTENDDEVTNTDSENNNVFPSPTIQAGERENSIYETENTPSEIIIPAGQIDFLATINAVGVLAENDEFIATSTLKVSDRIAVKFTVENIGGKKSSGWYFNAVLPTSPFHIFHSKSQRALAPGEKIEFTMGFDKPKEGENQTIIINVDPTGGVKESDKKNNIAKTFVTIVE